MNFLTPPWDFIGNHNDFIELLLNASILKPESDLSIFSGNFSLLKLVYYNPDYMHSSKTEPEPEVLPSIFDIY